MYRYGLNICSCSNITACYSDQEAGTGQAQKLNKQVSIYLHNKISLV